MALVGSLAVGRTKVRLPVTGGSYVPPTPADAYIAALPTPPDGARQTLIRTLFTNLQTGLVNGTNPYSKLDYLHRYACEAANNALIDMVQVIPYTGSTVNTPVFTVDRQYATDGTSSYIDTGFNPTGVTKYLQNDCSFFIWNRREGQNAASAAGWFNTGTSSGTTIAPRSATDTFNGRLNQNGTRVASGATTAVGLLGVNRNGSLFSDVQQYRNGVAQSVSGGATSAAIESGNFRCGAITAVNFGSRDFAFSGAGASLTVNEWADLYAALQAYMTAIGA